MCVKGDISLAYPKMAMARRLGFREQLEDVTRSCWKGRAHDSTYVE